MQPSELDGAAARLAAKQQEMVARWQLAQLGVSDDAILHRVRTGRWRKRRRGVYQLGTSRLTLRARWSCDVLACGPESAADGVTALMLWGVLRERAHETMAVTRRTGRRAPEEIRLRCSPNVPRFHTVDGIQTVDVPEALVVAAPHLDDEQLEAAYERALMRFDIDPRVIPERNRRLNQLIKDHRRGTALTDSELENLFRRVIRRAGLPQPMTKLRVGRRIPDFIWPDHGVVAEVNGPHHGLQMEADASRNAELCATGLIVQSFTKLQLIRRPQEIPASLSPFLRRVGDPWN